MIPLEEFLIHPGPIFDVRSPSEYAHGRIPGALNLPLFTDDERAAVGTTYKQVGQQEAVMQGLSFVGPKLTTFVEDARKHIPGEYAKVHCWRGGMRSSSMAWLLKTAGIKTLTLEGGYKTFRQWVLEMFEKPYKLKVLGGFTGCGKTALLQELRKRGEQVIDLEGLANHRGSAFGSLGMPPQPSSEQFQNEIACQLHAFDKERPIWIEDESSLVGTCSIPKPFFDQMGQAPLYVINRPLEVRLANLHEAYSHITRQDLIKATQRITKRLGGQRAKEIIENLESENFHQAAELVLQYYDKTYAHSITRRDRPKITIEAGFMTCEDFVKTMDGMD